MKRCRKVSILFFAVLLVAAVTSFVSAQEGEPRTASQLGDEEVFLPLILFEEAVPPVYPPLNKIVFSAGFTRENPFHDIYVMNADGSGRVKVADGGTTSYLYPVWSPDGSRIAFTAITYLGPGDIADEIRVMNADGTGMYNLVNVPGHHFHPAWSPYGDQIAFSSDTHNPGADTPNDIYVMNADGSGSPVNLTNTPAIHEAYPDWSPDGKRIAYVAESGSTWEVVEIYVMNADGSGPTNLTQSFASDFAPSWSPDGQRIAFDRNLGTYDAPDWEIFVMNADGGGQSRLTFSDGQNFFADWSPAGDQLAFQAYFEAYADIYVMNADGSGVTNITNSGNDYASVLPDWR